MEQTGANIFLTGRAGTGKTTFLKELKAHSPKRMIVVAPTGVAAINASGVTIHSFFQLPFGPYIPSMQVLGDGEGSGKRKMQFGKQKRMIIKSLDLLVIDEISMVRADLLDAVDDVLRRYRDHRKPFGGVQLLMIGDLQQLAPVVKNEERELIESVYPSPYFFDSKALRSTEYITIELETIYRQSDSDFIDILNRVRNNSIDSLLLARLNSRYIPSFDPDQSEGYITLTSHNDTAQQINDNKMAAIDYPEFGYECHTEGTFPEYLYPTQSELRLKKGAQVMFIKNDTSGLHRYFNGKIGLVTALDEQSIEVTTDDNPVPIEVEPAEWSNTKYSVDPQTKEIVEQVEGTFQQYPLKTAWAITIHKSQGLTFDRAIIDAAASFSHGQVYVALSRCRSFEGIVLRTPITAHSIVNDSKVAQFNENIHNNQPTEQQLAAEHKAYFESLVLEMFDFVELIKAIRAVRKVADQNFTTLYPKLCQLWSEREESFEQQVLSVSNRFHHQLVQLVAQSSDPDHSPELTERIVKGEHYFAERLESLLADLTDKSDISIDNKESAKQFAEVVGKFADTLTVKQAVLRIDCSDHFSIHNYLDARGKALLQDNRTKSTRSPKESSPSSDKPDNNQTTESVDIDHRELFELLREWRREQADERIVPAYIVLKQKSLIAICNTLPRTEQELLAIKGIGKSFVAQYAPEVIAMINDWIDTQSDL